VIKPAAKQIKIISFQRFSQVSIQSHMLCISVSGWHTLLDSMGVIR